MINISDDFEPDLFYYAFNYRNCSTQDAQEWFDALEKFVNDKIGEQNVENG